MASQVDADVGKLCIQFQRMHATAESGAQITRESRVHAANADFVFAANGSFGVGQNLDATLLGDRRAERRAGLLRAPGFMASSPAFSRAGKAANIVEQREIFSSLAIRALREGAVDKMRGVAVGRGDVELVLLGNRYPAISF